MCAQINLTKLRSSWAATVTLWHQQPPTAAYWFKRRRGQPSRTPPYLSVDVTSTESRGWPFRRKRLHSFGLLQKTDLFCKYYPVKVLQICMSDFFRQYDLREQHDCNTMSKVLIDLSRGSEVKCISVHPTKPHYIAIGANDCYIRLYDRRKLKPFAIQEVQ